MSKLQGKTITLIVGGGIAAYKVLELVRRLKDAGVTVRAILTKAGAEFVTPLSLAALTGEKVFSDLFSLTDEAEMGHIRLAREADLIVVAPATADLMAKMASGQANDLATATLLAAHGPILLAPAMNTGMWDNPATQRNLIQLQADGKLIVGPSAGNLACGEVGSGRLSEPADILARIEEILAPNPGPLAGYHAIVTAGPTHEPIDPVRYIANRSSGLQGYAIAKALADQGARVSLISGPTALAIPEGVTGVAVTTAEEMAAAVEAALPADIAICVAAVADYRPSDVAGDKIKKEAGGITAISLTENPDILARLSAPGPGRPRLVIGFAAETGNELEKAQRKRERKGCDWIIANDVADGKVMGKSTTTLHIVRADSVESWPEMEKISAANRIVDKIFVWLTKG